MTKKIENQPKGREKNTDNRGSPETEQGSQGSQGFQKTPNPKTESVRNNYLGPPPPKK